MQQGIFQRAVCPDQSFDNPFGQPDGKGNRAVRHFRQGPFR